jgi:hypothetical protein
MNITSHQNIRSGGEGKLDEYEVVRIPAGDCNLRARPGEQNILRK